MNKYFTQCLFLLLCCLSGGITRAQPGFQKLDDFSHNQWAYSFYTASYADTGKIIGIGRTYHDDPFVQGTVNNTTFIAAHDYSGNVLWEHKLRFADSVFYANESFIRHCLLKTSAGLYALGAYSYDCIPGSYCRIRPFIYWLDTNGDSLNFAALPVFDSSNNLLYAIGSDAAGNILATGKFQNRQNLADTNGIWLAKFAATGQFLWKSVAIDTPYIPTDVWSDKIIEGNNGGQYLVAGHTYPHDTVRDSRDVIWKFDSAGHLLWRKHIPKLYEWPTDIYADLPRFDIVKANNGSGYYFATVAPKGTVNNYRGVYYCGKLDEGGNIIWAKTYERGNGYEDGPSGLLQKPNGDLLINGGTFNTSTERGASALLLLDSLGNVKWYKAYQYANYCDYQPQQILYSLNVSPNGGIVRGGGLGQDNPQACWDSVGTYSLLVYTDSLGRLYPNDTATIPITAYPAQYGPVGIDEPAYSSKNDLIYPNPMHNVLNIDWQEEGKAKLVIRDVTGKVLLKATIINGYQQIDMSRLNAGFYIASIMVNGKTIYQQKVAKF